jgi:hypothetical protein
MRGLALNAISSKFDNVNRLFWVSFSIDTIHTTVCLDHVVRPSCHSDSMHTHSHGSCLMTNACYCPKSDLLNVIQRWNKDTLSKSILGRSICWTLQHQHPWPNSSYHFIDIELSVFSLSDNISRIYNRFTQRSMVTLSALATRRTIIWTAGSFVSRVFVLEEISTHAASPI